MQLQEYAVEESLQAEGDNRKYLPLAIGNRWAYGWAGLSSEITAREVYTVTAQTNADPEPGIWCLEHYAYAYKNHA